MENKEIRQAIEILQSAGYEVIPPISIDVISRDFEAWWNAYDKKRGKAKCLKKWQHMSSKDRAACISATPRYVASIANKVFQKDPFTYLNNRAWEDEVYYEYDESRQSQQRELSFAATARQVFESE